LGPIAGQCVDFCKGKNIVIPQGTCESNLTSHGGRIKKDMGLGKTAKDDILGFMLHGALAIDFESGVALGFPDIQIWDRGQLRTTKKERDYAQQPIADKESNKWLKSVGNSETILKEAANITFVGDRGPHIYNLYCCHRQANVDHVVGGRFDRKTANGSSTKGALAQTTVWHHHDLEILGDIRKNVQKRTAAMSLKWAGIEIELPGGHMDKALPKSIPMTVVETKETIGT
jgi:hypothetical protein